MGIPNNYTLRQEIEDLRNGFVEMVKNLSNHCVNEFHKIEFLTAQQEKEFNALRDAFKVVSPKKDIETDDKCEWEADKNSGKIFYCSGLAEKLGTRKMKDRLAEEIVKEGRYNCSICGADIRKPEPVEPARDEFMVAECTKPSKLDHLKCADYFYYSCDKSFTLCLNNKNDYEKCPYRKWFIGLQPIVNFQEAE